MTPRHEPEARRRSVLYVSTGHLSPSELVRALVAEARARFKADTDGENSRVYPALARVPRELFGICVVGTSGDVYPVGDADYEFTIMSVSKPFVFALVFEAMGVEEARQKIGVSGWTSTTSRVDGEAAAAVEPTVSGRCCIRRSRGSNVRDMGTRLCIRETHDPVIVADSSATDRASAGR